MIITLGTPKGGVGKTTVLLTVANGALLRNPDLKIAIIDTHTSVGSLSGFWARRKSSHKNEENLRLWKTDASDSDQAVLEKIGDGTNFADITLIDVQGAMSELNQMMIDISDITIFPTRLGLTDFEPAAANMIEYEYEAKRSGRVFNGRLLFTFVSDPRFMSKREKHILEAAHANGDIALLKTRLQKREAYKDAQDFGMLLKEYGGMNNSASLQGATGESIELFDELVEIFKEHTGHEGFAA